MHQAVAAHTPLKRLAQPEDIAGAVVFFCTE
jgi:3-oxoacyl-[acyl-carrier protein] reductase